MSIVPIDPLVRLDKDLRRAAATMGPAQARTLVDLYYQLQDFRLQAGNQNRQLTKAEEPHETVAFFHEQFHQLEKDIAKALDSFSGAQPLGIWARENVGVGPVIAAGLLAHIPIDKTPNISSLWTFAGLAPDQKYVKGQKRNWNARLKVLCWRAGDSFVKQSGRDNCYYGKLYRQRKEKETLRNEAVRLVPQSTLTGGQAVSLEERGAVLIEGNYLIGGNAKAAAKSLKEKNIRDKELLVLLHSGKLPDGQLDLRARRYAVKRFLAHYWQAGYRLEYGRPAPEAYVFEHLGHVDNDPPPVPFPPLPKEK